MDLRETESAGGIVFCEQTISVNKPYWGTVKAVGPEVQHCKEGDSVFVPWELGTALRLNDREVVIIREAQVLAKGV